MIDLNFVRYAMESKRRQMETATGSEFSQLETDHDELSRILGEGKRKDRELNQKWLSVPMVRPQHGKSETNIVRI